MNSARSRREFLTIFGAASLFAIGELTTGCKMRNTKGKAIRDISFWGTSTLDVGNDVWNRLQSDLNAHIIFKDNRNTPGPVIAQMIGGSAATDHDLGGLLTGAAGILAEAGTILPWDLGQIPNWNSAWSWAKSLERSRYKGKQFGLPLVVNADSMVYLPERMKQIPGYESGIVDSYGAIFDPRLRGKTSMEDAWVNSVLFTSMYLSHNHLLKIADPRNLTESELKEVMTFLIDHKRAGQFKKLWNGWEEGLQLLRSGDVFVLTGWEPMVKALNAEGVGARYAVPKEGYEGWSIDLLLHTGAAKHGSVDLCHSVANWLCGGYYGVRMEAERGYAVPNYSTQTYVANNHVSNGADVVSTLKDREDRILSTINWQNVRPDNYRLYEEWWSKFTSA